MPDCGSGSYRFKSYHRAFFFIFMKKNKNPFKTFSSFYKRTFYKYKTLLKGAFNTGGRNNTGRITVANRGGRQKRKFRNIV